jgi:hypothetical protein
MKSILGERNGEPLWRTVLTWGCVAYFLGLPAMALVMGLAHISFMPGTNVAKFLADFHFSVSALVAAMAGLNSFDRRKETLATPETPAPKRKDS